MSKRPPELPRASLPPDLARLHKLAHMMDAAFRVPLTNIRVGLDALIGLVPGVGDVATAAVSASVVLAAFRHRVPGVVIARMVANIVIDAALGAVPVVGDVFDALHRAHLRNLELLLRHRDEALPPRTAPAALGALVFSLAVVVGGSVTALVALALVLVTKLAG